MGYDFKYKFLTKEEKEAYEKISFDDEGEWDTDNYDQAEKYYIDRHNRSLYGGIYTKDELVKRIEEILNQIKVPLEWCGEDDDLREAFFVYSMILREFSSNKDLDQMVVHIIYE